MLAVLQNPRTSLAAGGIGKVLMETDFKRKPRTANRANETRRKGHRLPANWLTKNIQHRLGLELVAQSELHYARVGKQSGVVAKRTAVGQRQTQALNVKPGQVQGVEDIPPELKRLRLLPRHLPA